MGQYVLGLAGAIAPPLRPNLLDSSFISSLSGSSMWPLSSVLATQSASPSLLTLFPLPTWPFPIPGQSAFICLLISLDSQDSQKKVFRDGNIEPEPFKGRLQRTQPHLDSAWPSSL